MELSIFRHLWGITEGWETLFPRISALGYRGIEHILPEEGDVSRFRHLLDKHGFKYIAQIVTTGSTVEDHLHSFRQNVERASTLKPQTINCHSGCDWFTEEDGLECTGTKGDEGIDTDAGVRGSGLPPNAAVHEDAGRRSLGHLQLAGSQAAIPVLGPSPRGVKKRASLNQRGSLLLQMKMQMH